MIDNLVSNFLQIIFIFLKSMATGIIGPIISAIDSLINTLGLNNYFYLFNDLLTDYIAPAVGFFFQFMGPLTTTVILFEFAVFIGFYAIMISTTWILKFLNVVKKLPIA